MLIPTDAQNSGSFTSSLHTLDSSEWGARLFLKAYGVRIEIRCNEPSVLHAARKYLPSDWVTPTLRDVDRIYSFSAPTQRTHASGHLNLLYADDLVLARCTTMEDLLERLESDVRLTVADRALNRVFVHAGVVGWKGKAILIPGRSLSGKSSLVAELGRKGATILKGTRGEASEMVDKLLCRYADW